MMHIGPAFRRMLLILACVFPLAELAAAQNGGNSAAAGKTAEQRAAEGDVAAMMELGDRYRTGDGVAIDLERALAWYARLGVRVERVMTDNGSAYKSKLFAAAIAQAGVRHLRTKPYTPRTNGKAERFIQTSLREWAYARPYTSSDQRNAAIGPWTDAYNLSRPHSAIGHRPPIERLNNLLGNDT